MKDILAKDVSDEIFHHQIHVCLRCCSETSRFDVQLPLLEVGLLKGLLSIRIEFVELVLEEQGARASDVFGFRRDR